MSLLRFDATTNDWVIFAPERARRPRGLKSAEAADEAAASCPFCPGNEGMTATEIHAVRGSPAPNAPDWRVRVVPNKFPALRIEDNPRRMEEGPLFRAMGGCGAHEVVVEGPDHDRFLWQQPVEHVELLLRTLQVRFNDLMRDSRFQTIVVFKNHGEGAGTSLRHPHWQLIATPVVPRLLRLKHAVATDYFDLTGRCLYCALLEEEVAAGTRVVLENDQYAAVLPYAAHVPFQIRILPKEHRASFGSVAPVRLGPLAELLREVLARLDLALDNPDFNLTINTVPRGDEDKEYFLWHIDLVPRLATPAGFEMGSGMAINTVLPEDAAAALRTVAIA